MTTETLLEFPCEFPIKAFGHAHEDFEGLVVALVRRHTPNLGEAAVSSRPSNGGKFTAVTVVIQAESKAQIDAIYLDLTARREVLMAL
jgi:putative lipoic acid-binding regulatory protein